MSRTRNNVIGILAAVLVATAVTPAASVAQLGATAPEYPVSGLGDRTATELGQAVGEPGDDGAAAANARASRTPTELAQQVAPSPVAPGVATSGFDWGDAAIGAGAVLALGLVAFGGLALIDRRRSTTSARVPAVTT